MTPAGAASDIIARCLAKGFALAGVAPARPSAWSAHLRDWLARGCHGEMDYMARDGHLRENPAELFPGTRAFIVVADQYARRGDADPAGDDRAPQGRIARYARGRNYHEVMKRRLHAIADQLRIDYPGSDFRTCVDTAPILERELAALAGVGWQGKNTLIINPRVGSWLLLGVVATTMDIEPRPASQPPPTDACGSCTRCLDACPTGAITPYQVDATRCISYLTIEHRGVIAPELHAPMGDWVFGCDVCQEVCPHNSPRDDTRDVGRVHAAYEARVRSIPLEAMVSWDVGARQEACRTSAMKRASLEQMRRNAIIAAGNALRSGEQPALRAALEAIRDDPEEPSLLRETALQVLGDAPPPASGRR